MTDTRAGVQARAEPSGDELDRLMRGSADRVFATPVQVGRHVVIPVATTEAGFGFGFRARRAPDRGGYRARRAVARIEAGPNGVRVKPVVDLTRVGVALAAAAFTVWRATRR